MLAQQSERSIQLAHEDLATPGLKIFVSLEGSLKIEVGLEKKNEIGAV